MRKIVLVILFVVFIILIILFIVLFKSHKSITHYTSLVPKSPVTRISPKSYMTISSSAFANNGIIPSKYTCDGQSINPPLSFEMVPADTKSLAMLMDDPDAPGGTFDHWVLYNIPPTSHEIAENSVPQGAVQGLNSSGQEKYTDPCPPDREHRYFFTLYALNTKLKFSDPSKVSKQAVIDKMQGHIIAQAELLGRYKRLQNNQ